MAKVPEDLDSILDDALEAFDDVATTTSGPTTIVTHPPDISPEASAVVVPAQADVVDTNAAADIPLPLSREEAAGLPTGAGNDVEGEGEVDDAGKALEDALRALGELGLGQSPGSGPGGVGDANGSSADDVTEADMKLVEEFITSLGESLSGLGGVDPNVLANLNPLASGPAASAANNLPSSSSTSSRQPPSHAHNHAPIAQSRTPAQQQQSQPQEQSHPQQPVVEKLVESIVGHLLSEDVLKEPMMQMRAAYNEWLPKNESKLSAQDQQRYRRQKELVEQICLHYERGAGVTEIMELLSFMQETGAPPNEVMEQLSTEGGMDGFLQRLGALDMNK